MATPLTDSINALTAYANEVTGASDTTLSDAVKTLVIGYGQGSEADSYIQLARSFDAFFFNQKNLPQKIVLNPIQLDSTKKNREVFCDAYETGYNTATLDVTLILNQTTTFSLARFFWGAYGVKKITIQGNLNLCTEYTNMLQSLYDVEEIDAVFDFSSCPYPSNTVGVISSSNGGNKVLKEMRFAPNTARVKIAITGFEELSDESLVSVANCLVEGVGQSLVLHSSRTTRCASIMGSNDNGTFVADENGTMSLADFITTVKGWTLA